MGRPKLLLPLGQGTVISQVLAVLDRPELACTVVVIRADDAALRSAITAARAVAICPPADPPEMRDSVEFALNYLTTQFQPDASDAWLLSPADHPLLDGDVLSALLARWASADCSILVPTWRGRRGHPVLFRWTLAAEVAALPADRGLNELVRRHAAEVTELPVESDSILADVDTPADYERLIRTQGPTRPA